MFPDPDPTSSQAEQDKSFAKLRNLLQKQIELSIQVQAMNSNRGSGPVNSFDDAPADEWNGAEGDGLADDWVEPPADDPSHSLFLMAKQVNNVAKQAYAVFHKAYKGKGKGKGPTRATPIPKGAGKSRTPRCVNCTEEGHTFANCPLPPVPVGQRKCFKCKKTGHQASKCPNVTTSRPTAGSVQKDEKVIFMLTEERDPPAGSSSRRVVPAGESVAVSNRYAALTDSDDNDEHLSIPMHSSAPRRKSRLCGDYHASCCMGCIEPAVCEPVGLADSIPRWEVSADPGEAESILRRVDSAQPSTYAPAECIYAKQQDSLACQGAPKPTEVGTPGAPPADSIPRWEVSAGGWIPVKHHKRSKTGKSKGTPARVGPHGRLLILEHEAESLNNVQSDLPFEVVLDSGAADHVTDNVDAPGYSVSPSPGSKAGRSFIAANGGKIPNRGQMTPSLKTESGQEIDSTFQVCKTNRPLWSVGKICDTGCKVAFSADKAEVVQEKTGRSVCSFQREGGLYVSKLSLTPPDAPSSFTRQGR